MHLGLPLASALAGEEGGRPDGRARRGRAQPDCRGHTWESPGGARGAGRTRALTELRGSRPQGPQPQTSCRPSGGRSMGDAAPALPNPSPLIPAPTRTLYTPGFQHPVDEEAREGSKSRSPRTCPHCYSCP